MAEENARRLSVRFAQPLTKQGSRLLTIGLLDNKNEGEGEDC